ncbi:MAG: hypothetical protein AAF917_10205, partial [Pseudomonadota bacterium]
VTYKSCCGHVSGSPASASSVSSMSIIGGTAPVSSGFGVAAPLHASRDGRMAALAGATGLLTLDVDGRLHRSLAWAEFVDGAATPKPLDTGAVPPMIDIDDTEEAEAGDPLTWPQQDL